MEFTTLGRTGLTVSVAGLGCGGHSRLGQAYGSNVNESVAVVAAALDAGINFIDTAAAYRTEPIVGQALSGRRDQAVISSKTAVTKRAADSAEPCFISAGELTKQLEDSLTHMQTDYVDIYSLHGVLPLELDYVESELVPTLLNLQQQGKLRFLGITERFALDTNHVMLQRAVATDVWDVVMVGFNLLNPSARQTVLCQTQRLNVGVQDMFAVRRALSDAPALAEAIQTAMQADQIDPKALAGEQPVQHLQNIVKESNAESLIDMAYRFCRHEPGINVVLTGTGKIEHLTENISSLNRPALSTHTQTQLAELFGCVDCISGN